jgi:hypothetical protein
MSLFDELKIRYQTIDDDVWVNLSDLSNHLLRATKEFAEESVVSSWDKPVQLSEAIFFRGLAEGMMSIVALLAQGGVEAEFHEKVHTVEDLLKKLGEKNGQ